jgi:hypothetical protein
MGYIHRETYEFSQNLFQILIGTHNAADAMQQCDLAARTFPHSYHFYRFPVSPVKP